MKSLFSFLLCLMLAFAPAALSAINPPTASEVEVIITPQRILLVADELPVKSLGVQIFDATSRVVMTQQFSSKTADWSLDVSALPVGSYTVQVGDQAPVPFIKNSAGNTSL